MIEYDKVQTGDILEITGAGAPGFAANGELVRVLSVTKNGITVERKDGERCDFVYNCGAARLNPTEWKGDFALANAGPQESAEAK